ncbi:hypothetical protein FI667_g8524, partial [Globisporangium splendens]
MYTKLAIIEEAPCGRKRQPGGSRNGWESGDPSEARCRDRKVYHCAETGKSGAAQENTVAAGEVPRARGKVASGKAQTAFVTTSNNDANVCSSGNCDFKTKRNSNQDTPKAQHTFQGLTLDKQVENARKLHRETFSSELEQVLKSRSIVAEKQLVKLQRENEMLRSQGNTNGRSEADNNDGTGSSGGDLGDEHRGQRSKASGIEVEQLKRELRDPAEREIQEKALDQMETMNRQVHKLRTQLQDAAMEKNHLEARAAKTSELEKELLLIRDQNRRLEERMTTLCESPFINDAFQRKERIDKLFDLEKLTEQQKLSINHMTDENQKLQFERFDWREQGVVSLDEFAAIAQQNGFQVFTPLQLKQIAKCFGAKLRGQFGINCRQFLDWTNLPPTIDVDEVETKPRRFAHTQAEQVASKKATQVLSNWQQLFASVDTMKHGLLTRAAFAEVVKTKLNLPLSDEEIRALLHSYDHALEDQVDYEGFVQLNWTAASKAYAESKQIHFGKQTSFPKNLRTAELAHSIPRSEHEGIEKGDLRCSHQDLLQCLIRQLSTVDFYSQVDIVDDWQHTGTIKLKHLMRTFDQVGLSLTKDAIPSLESYFAADGDEKVIMYEKLIDALKTLYEVTCEENDEEKADAQRKRKSRDTNREHK